LRSGRWLISATGAAGWNWNNSTLEGATTAALRSCPGGRILSTGDIRGFYAVDHWRDGKGDIGISLGLANTLSEARRLANKQCSDRGRTIVKNSGYWQETVGSPPAAPA